jgi:hypothetical protein
MSNCKTITELYKYLTKDKECKKKKKHNNEKKVIPCINNLIDNTNRLTDHKINSLSLVMKNILSNLKLPDNHHNNNHHHNNHNIFTFDRPGNYRKDFPKDCKILLQMMGGGGSGGVSYIHNEIIIYAGGGGAGQYYSQYIKVEKNSYWEIEIGSAENNTELKIYDCKNKLLLSIIAIGGKPGVYITPEIINKNPEKGNSRFRELIYGGSCHDNNGNGSNGCISVPSITGKTGDGGQIIGKTGIGGKGGTPEHPDGGDGFYGSGGGGALPYSNPGIGGSGYLIGEIIE